MMEQTMFNFMRRQWVRVQRDESGAEVLEFIGILPLMAFIMLIFVQVVLFGVTAVTATGAAHAGARAAAIQSCDAAGGAANRASLRWSEATRSINCVCTDVCQVSVALRIPSALKGVVNLWYPTTATMPSEREGG